MSIETWLLFVLASAALIATPGPNVALVVGTTLRHGRAPGLMAVAGVNAGVILQLCTVAAGLSWIVEAFSAHFDLIRYLGAGYLLFLAAQQLRSKPVSPGVAAPALAPKRAFARGFLIAFANPKTLVFFAAFLPLFIDANAGPSAALWLLVATFAVIAATGDTLFVLAAAKLGRAVSGRYARIADRASAAILVGGAVVLLAAGRR